MLDENDLVGDGVALQLDLQVADGVDVEGLLVKILEVGAAYPGAAL